MFANPQHEKLATRDEKLSPWWNVETIGPADDERIARTHGNRAVMVVQHGAAVHA